MSASNKVTFSSPYFPTASSLLHIREILVHWPFLEISGPQKWVVGAILALKHNFLAGTLFIAKKLELFCSRPTFLDELAGNACYAGYKIFSPLTDIPVAKTEISGTEPARSLI